MSDTPREMGDAGARRAAVAETGIDAPSAMVAESVDPSGRPAADDEATASAGGAARSASGRAARSAAYFYAVLRLVPNVERGERFNVGVVLFSRSRRFIGLRTALDPRKLAALAPECDPEPVARQLVALRAIAEGAAGGGPVARLDPAERFHWLTAPSSTMIQPSPVHTGLSADPAATLDRLFTALVLD